MKRPTTLYTVLVGEILQQHNLSESMDVEAIQRRVEKEGDSFLSITLPSFGASLEQALEEGFVTRVAFPGFGKDRRGVLPKFLKGLLTKIFSKCGRLLDDPDPDAIYGIRQICYWAKKPKATCSEKRSKAAIQRYRSIEEDLSRFDSIVLGKIQYFEKSVTFYGVVQSFLI
jgi:hypothetical protein